MPEELKQMTEDDIQSIVSDAIKDAVDFVESEIAESRIKAQRYFDGEVDIGEEKGRSKIVSTKVRDTVRAIKPSLMRVFLSSENPVEYIPANQQQVEMADQATKFAHYAFQRENGYKLINEAIHDALVKKTGVLKAYWEDTSESEIFDYSHLTEEEMTALVGEKEITVVEQEVEMHPVTNETGESVDKPYYSLKVSRVQTSGKLSIESVPPEEFFVDRNAKTIEDAYIVVHRTEMRVSDLVSIGYDFDQVSKLSGLAYEDTFTDAEKYERSNYSEDASEDITDPSMRLVAISEAYMRIDVYGTGEAVMHKIVLGGASYELLDHEPWGDVPFAVFEIDPEPHTFYGRSIADLIMNDQDASTAMIRGLLDNIALTNNPAIDVVEGQANIDDVLNNEIGAIRRIKSPGAITVNAVPFIAGQTLGAVQYMDEQVENKTGITRASMGLDPDALQNTTATAAQITAQRGSGQIEVIARNLAEGGMKRLFKLILHLLVENSCEEMMMRLNGQYVPMDPRRWNADMDLTVNVGLGTGQEDQKHMALSQALQMQMQIWQNYGPTNGLVTMVGIRNTLGDMLGLAGVRNVDRYFSPMTPEQEQQLVQQAQQAQSQQTSPEQELARATVEAETIRAQSKMQTDSMKIKIDAQKAIATDDRERDRMDQDLLIEAARILGQWGQKIDVEEIKKMQDKPRYDQTEPTQAVTTGRY
jgi:hypothetical protein